jgi:hypothetical protein
MKLAFNLESVHTTEFGVGRYVDDAEAFLLVPVDANVQDVLREMATATWEAMQNNTEDPEEYQPSEKHGGQQYVYLEAASPFAGPLQNLHTANNLPTDADALSEPSLLFLYFARFVDARHRRLTAVRRATQFKGVLRARLLRFIDDTLQLLQENTFRLDSDFDLLIDSSYVHILRPSGFEIIGGLQEAIRSAVPANIAQIKADMPFVNFDGIQSYAERHTRAARHLASIRSQQETLNISPTLLRNVCKTQKIGFTTNKGVITVDAGQEMDFLDVLDRRRYELELVAGSQELYKAASRRKI